MGAEAEGGDMVAVGSGADAEVFEEAGICRLDGDGGVFAAEVERDRLWPAEQQLEGLSRNQYGVSGFQFACSLRALRSLRLAAGLNAKAAKIAKKNAKRRSDTFPTLLSLELSSRS